MIELSKDRWFQVGIAQAMVFRWRDEPKKPCAFKRYKISRLSNFCIPQQMCTRQLHRFVSGLRRQPMGRCNARIGQRMKKNLEKCNGKKMPFYLKIKFKIEKRIK